MVQLEKSFFAVDVVELGSVIIFVFIVLCV